MGVMSIRSIHRQWSGVACRAGLLGCWASLPVVTDGDIGDLRFPFV